MKQREKYFKKASARRVEFRRSCSIATDEHRFSIHIHSYCKRMIAGMGATEKDVFDLVPCTQKKVVEFIIKAIK